MRLGTRNLSMLAVLTVLGTALLAPAPAQAASVTLDCSTGPVTLSEAFMEYDLVGSCSTVQVTSVRVVVRLTSASLLEVTNTDATVFATGRLDELVVEGPGTTVTAGSVGRATLARVLVALTTPRAGTIRVPSDGPRVRVGRADRLVIGAGVDGRYTFTHLRRVQVSRYGVANHIRVRRGATVVHDAGRHNHIHVHRRA